MWGCWCAQRKLDDLVKNRVRASGAEAERKQKSRQAIILDKDAARKGEWGPVGGQQSGTC